MDPKQLEKLADLVVGKITMPGHAFAAWDACPLTTPYDCPGGAYGVGRGSDFIVCDPSVSCKTMFGCSVDYRGCTPVKGDFVCTIGVNFTCTGSYTP